VTFLDEPTTFRQLGGAGWHDTPAICAFPGDFGKPTLRSQSKPRNLRTAEFESEKRAGSRS
jgi:hypothetical protein